MPRRGRPSLTLVLLAAALAVPLTGPDAVAELEPAPRRLASEFARAARSYVVGGAMSVASLDTARLMLEESIALDPDNVDHWRDLLALATLMEQDDLQQRALSRVVELDPTDEMSRLRRLAFYLEQFQTAETRIAAYRRLLEPARREQLGPAVAARLAVDLAHLQRRRGEIREFGRWVAEAVAIDPSNCSAAALAAGYFRVNVDDPYAEAELLTTLMLADPTDVASQVTLAQLLLEHGAYHGAARIYSIAADGQTVTRLRAEGELLADLATARWGAGDAEGALLAIREHQRVTNDLFRGQIRHENPEMSLPEVMRMEAPLGTTIAAVRAIILTESGNESAEDAVTRLIESFDWQIEMAREADPPDPVAVASLQLRLALALLWSGRERERVDELIAAAESVSPLSEVAQRRFDGWKALREGRVDEAVDLLVTHAEGDPPSAIGLALARLEQDRPADAARQFLAVARDQPGTLLGVWSVNRLAALVGRRTPLDDLAGRLDALIETIPHQVDRYPRNPTTAVSVRVRSEQRTYTAYEPLMIELRITNHSPYALAVDREGPIRPQVLLRPTAQVLAGKPLRTFPHVVIDIDRRLRLESGESITIDLDLRRTWVGQVLNEYAISGGLVGLEAWLNFRTNLRGSFEPDLLGSRVESPSLRVNGERVSDDWLAETARHVLDPTDTERARQLALLCNVISTWSRRAVPLKLDEAAVDSAATVVPEAFLSLDPLEQAWLIAVTPPSARDTALRPLLEAARDSEHRLVRLAYLVIHVEGPEDPGIDAALGGGDATLAAVADHMRTILERVAEAEDASSAAPDS